LLDFSVPTSVGAHRIRRNASAFVVAYCFSAAFVTQSRSASND